MPLTHCSHPFPRSQPPLPALAGPQVFFNVTVTKGDEALVFNCASDGTYLDIRHVSHEPAEGIASETAYTGEWGRR